MAKGAPMRMLCTIPSVTSQEDSIQDEAKAIQRELEELNERTDRHRPRDSLQSTLQDMLKITHEKAN